VYVFDSVCYIHTAREMSLNSRILKHVELIFIGLSNVHLLPESRNWDVSLFLFLSFVFFIKWPNHRFVLRLFIHAILKHVKISCLSIIEKWPCLNRTCKCQNHGLTCSIQLSLRQVTEFCYAICETWPKSILTDQYLGKERPVYLQRSLYHTSFALNSDSFLT